MTEAPGGLRAAVRALIDSTREMREGEQLSLLPSAAARADLEGGDAAAGRAGPGRPRGSRNKSTSAWVKYLSARYPSPLIFLAEAYARPAEQLAAELGCTVKEAFVIQRDAAIALAPYWHGKQPMALSIDAKGGVPLIIQRPGDAPLPGDGARLIGGRILESSDLDGAESETEGNQRVSEGEPDDV